MIDTMIDTAPYVMCGALFGMFAGFFLACCAFILAWEQFHRGRP